jgi:hypothetical protein
MNTTKLANTPKPAPWPFQRGTPYWNERVKLFATFFNNLGVGFWVFGAVGAVYQPERFTVLVLMGGLAIGIVCHVVAQICLRGME